MWDGEAFVPVELTGQVGNIDTVAWGPSSHGGYDGFDPRRMLAQAGGTPPASPVQRVLFEGKCLLANTSDKVKAHLKAGNNAFKMLAVQMLENQAKLEGKVFDGQFVLNFVTPRVEVCGSDPDTFVVPDVSGDWKINHFVTVKTSHPSFIELEAKFYILNFLNIEQIDDMFNDGKLTWQCKGSSLAVDPTNSRKIKISRMTGSGKKIDLEMHYLGKKIWEGYVWVVWSELKQKIIPTVIGPHRRYSLPMSPIPSLTCINVNNEVTDFVTLQTNGYVYHSYIIKPEEIIKGDHIPTFNYKIINTGVHYKDDTPLHLGANNAWDITRNVELIIRNNGIPKEQFPKLLIKYKNGDEFGLPIQTEDFYERIFNVSNQPQKEFIVYYPKNVCDGTDDSGTEDEDSNPYNKIDNLDLFEKMKIVPEIGELVQIDAPQVDMSIPRGVDATFSYTLNFNEFVRLQLGDVNKTPKWYKISDDSLWYFSLDVHFYNYKFRDIRSGIYHGNK